MSIGSFGGVGGSAAGAPLSQTKGSETERNQQQSAAAERGAELEKKAADAAGIGTTAEDQETSDRDADGRRTYDDTLEIESDDSQEAEEDVAEKKHKPGPGEPGHTLDLIG